MPTPKLKPPKNPNHPDDPTEDPEDDAPHFIDDATVSSAFSQTLPSTSKYVDPPSHKHEPIEKTFPYFRERFFDHNHT